MSKIIIHNAETNEITEREMNKKELDQAKIDAAYYATQKTEAEAKESAKAAIADRLGLSIDELKLLLG
jgi:hypothetical protein